MGAFQRVAKMVDEGHSLEALWRRCASCRSHGRLVSVLTGVRSMNEVFPMDRVAEAYERMLSGKARFRVVLTTTAS